MADFNERDRRTTEELKEKSKPVARLKAEVTELQKNEALTKEKAAEEFKSSENF